MAQKKDRLEGYKKSLYDTDSKETRQRLQALLK
jgi:hypothetical protein